MLSEKCFGKNENKCSFFNIASMSLKITQEVRLSDNVLTPHRVLNDLSHLGCLVLELFSIKLFRGTLGLVDL